MAASLVSELVEKFRARAERCLAEAERSASSAERDQWQSIAARWLLFAREEAFETQPLEKRSGRRPNDRRRSRGTGREAGNLSTTRSTRGHPSELTERAQMIE